MNDNGRIRVLHFMSHLGTGGGPYHILRHLNAMDRSEFEHTMVSVHAPYTLAYIFEESSIPVVRLDHQGGTRLPSSIWKVANLVRSQSIDVIHSNTRPDRLISHPVAAITSRPVVNTLRSQFSARFYPPDEPGDRRRIRQMIEHSMYHRVVRQTVAISDSARREWIRSAPANLTEIPVEVVYPGLDLDSFDSRLEADHGQLRKDLEIEGRGPILIHVARLNPNKGHSYAIEAMQQVVSSYPGAMLLFAGEGPVRGEIEQKIEAMGLTGSVRLLGDRSDVPNLLSIADLFVFPSISEGFGVALLEAAAAGLPIVTFDIEPFDEWLEDGESGYFAILGDSASLAEAVLGVLDDPDAAERMGRRNRLVAEQRMDVKISADRLANVYRTLASGYSNST